MSLTYVEALSLQSDYAKSITGLYIECCTVGTEECTRVNEPDGIHYHFDTEYVLSHYLLKIKPLKASSHVGTICHWGENITLASMKFTTLEDARNKYNRLLNNLAKKTPKGSELLRKQLNYFDEFIRSMLNYKGFYKYCYLEGKI